MLTVVMALSLVVVASATDDVPGTVNLVIEPAESDDAANGKESLVYYIYMRPQGNADVGAAQFTLKAPAGTTFTVDFNTEYVYNDSGAGIGSGNGIFEKGAITNAKDGDLGGHLEDGGTTFKAVLAGTVRKAANGMERRILTADTSTEKGYKNEWLYKVTLAVPAFDGKTNYTLTVSDATAGFNAAKSETTTVDSVTVKHTVNVSSKGYGGIPGDVNGDGNVDVDDVLACLDLCFGTPTADDMRKADLNGDKSIDVDDVLICLDLCF